MTGLWFFAIYFCVNNFVPVQLEKTLEYHFLEHEVVPDVLSTAPAEYLYVNFQSGAVVNTGNELTPTLVKDIPHVWWDSADPQKLYTVAFVDPDAPSRISPTSRAFLHWLVGNVPGNDVMAGDVIAEYIGSGPGEGSGLHRYVFLVYEQPSELVFMETRVNNTSTENRASFSISAFAEKYDLTLIAGNFYQAEYDDYVPILHEQLGLS
ncbi:protein D3-like [Helicoverpa armigera]|uniref:protein D3-like n=1 Tax=Helicoverpa armigera TaxID=29058 RepID=UPI0030836756